MNRGVAIVECCTLLDMHRTMKIYQLNVQKQRAVQHSVMNDDDLEQYAALALSEPYCFRKDEEVVTVPLGHANWTKMIPNTQHEERWAIRSMLWIRKDMECEQLAVPSADITAALLRLPDRSVLVASIYVEGQNADALCEAMGLLHELIGDTRRRVGTRVDIILAGDFNRHDVLWGGDEVSPQRQGEADPIIDLMNDWSLHSLLPRGTKTWSNARHASTIDLMLASHDLASTMTRCDVHATEHGSDHRAIETNFDVACPTHVAEPRLLFKNAPWRSIRQRIETVQQRQVMGGSVQEQTDRLMGTVLEAIHALTPRARPSAYAKRWWTRDLTQLRRVYTYHRNQARSQRRAGMTRPDLEHQARCVAKEYHDAIRQRQRAHWDDFLADTANIWKAAKYLQPSGAIAQDKIPPLVRGDGSQTRDKTEQATELLRTFFPPLPDVIEEKGERRQHDVIAMPNLTMEEVERSVFAAKPWKAAGRPRYGKKSGRW